MRNKILLIFGLLILMFSFAGKGKAAEEIYNQNAVTITTLSALPAGSYVLDESSVWKFRKNSNYTGNIANEFPIFWYKLENNHYMPNSVLLFSCDDIADYPYNLKANGVKDWANSDLRKFLNGIFYAHFSEGLKDLILETDIPYRDLKGDIKISKDKIFLLSATEMDLTDEKGEKVEEKFSEGTSIKYDDIQGAIYSKNRVGSTSAFFPVRTINPNVIPQRALFGYSKNANALTSSLISMSFLDLRPAINIKGSTVVQGPYEIKLLYPTRVIKYYKIIAY